jgi:hypothetical protein
MRPSFEEGVMPMMNLVYKILAPDTELMDVLNEITGGMFPMFALSWVLTLFSHDLEDYEAVCRIFDFALAGPPLVSVYLAAAMTSIHRQQILVM